MTTANQLAVDKEDTVDKLNWLRVLAFGGEVVKVKTQKPSTPAQTPAFIVLP